MGHQEKGRAQFVGLKRGPNKPDFSGSAGSEKYGAQGSFCELFLTRKSLETIQINLFYVFEFHCDYKAVFMKKKP